MSSSTTLVRVDEFPLPRGSNGRSIVASAVIMLLSARPQILQPGSPLYDTLQLSRRPQALKVSRWLQQAVFYFFFGAHSIEMVIFAFVRLRKHGVPVFSVLGFKWLAAVFLGGKFAWAHFDELVAKKATRAQ